MSHIYTTKNRIYRLTAFIIAAVLFLSVLCPVITSADTDSLEDDFKWPSGPFVNAAAAIVMEASTGLILYEKDIYSAYYPASITKIMTALLALENNSLNETITMSHEAEWDVDFDSSRIGLVEGEQLSMEDGLYAVMLESANEVSYCVGEHVAGGKMSVFTEMMNERVKELGGVNTNFTNPHGLHNDNHYTCAYDMALISRAAIANPIFRTITGSRTHQIPPTNKNVLRYLANHHRFIRKTLNYDGAIGGKTGGTAEAKTTLVTYAERNGLLLIAVVLYVDTAIHAYEDTAAILDFGFDNYSLYNIIQTENLYDLVFPSVFDYGPFFTRESEEIIYVSLNSNIVLPKTADFNDAEKTISYAPVEEFVHGENVIGSISYTYAGRYVGATDIIYYNKSSPVTRAEFARRWPKYLIIPETAESDSQLSSDDILSNGTDKANVDDGSMYISLKTFAGNITLHRTSLIIGIAVAVVLFLLGIVLIVMIFRKNEY